MSEKPKDDGGRAFPNDGAWANNNPEGGMSLRDYFAAKAMAGMAARDSFDEGQATPEKRARLAYIEADAMLIERAKP